METKIADNFSSFAKSIKEKTGGNINLCYQCFKCTAGCPVAYAMDYTPAQLVHAIRLGMEELVFASKTAWLCASCETCTTRCPQEVDIAKIMDAVKILALKKGCKSPLPRVPAFYKASLGSIKRFGRMYELGMIAELKLRTKEFFKDMGLGIKMFKKRKLALFPSFKGSSSTRKIFSRVKKLEGK